MKNDKSSDFTFIRIAFGTNKDGDRDRPHLHTKIFGYM